MAEYIEREVACKDCSHYPVCEDKLFGSNHKNCRHFQNKADVVEVRHGVWLPPSTVAFTQVCSCCEDYVFLDKFGQAQEYKYCPNCGAKMDGKGEGE